MGVLRLGAVPSPANPAYNVPELMHQMEDSKAQYLIAHAESLDVAVKAARNAGIPTSKVLVIGDSFDGYVGISDLIVYGKASPAIEEISFAPGEAGGRLAFLCYSSGTSGLPKGVLMSHRNLIANLCQGYEFAKHGPYFGTDRVAVGVLPFYHSSTASLTWLTYSVWYAFVSSPNLALRDNSCHCSRLRSQAVSRVYQNVTAALRSS
jgi:acyl-CoA synthetase (AMP-forming)/AMP-acid ligase II